MNARKLTMILTSLIGLVGCGRAGFQPIIDLEQTHSSTEDSARFERLNSLGADEKRPNPVSLYAPASATIGQSITLNFRSVDMNVCLLYSKYPDLILRRSQVGGLTGTLEVRLFSSTVFRLDCYRNRSDGWVTRQVLVDVPSSDKPSDLWLSADHQVLDYGQSTALRATSVNMHVCNLYSVNPTVLIATSQIRGINGKFIVRPTSTTTYRLDCYRRPTDGWTRKEFKIEVSSPVRNDVSLHEGNHGSPP